MSIAKLLVLCLEVYAALGCGAALVFLLFGLDRVEPSARGAYAFRPLIVPGLILLWPLVLWRWRRIESGQGPDLSLERRHFARHDLAWRLLAAVLPAILLVTLALRQSGPIERPAVPLDGRAMAVETGR